MIYQIIIFFLFGCILGSFYHVVGYRLPKNESILQPSRSYCNQCHQELKWYELIPIVSYIIQKGKCRHCHEKISIFHPFIELVTGLLFATCFYSFGYSYELIIAISLVSLFSVVIVSDLTYMIIPDEVTILVAIVIMIVNILNIGIKGAIIQLGSGILTFSIMYFIMICGNQIFKKETLGGADIKLMFLSGLVLHPILGIFVIFIASCIALPVSLVIYMINKEHMIPFGPFIVASILLFYLLKIDVASFLRLFVF